MSAASPPSPTASRRPQRSSLPLLASLAWTCGVAYLLARAVAQFRAYPTVNAVGRLSRRAPPRLTVIVPARNEASRIGRCIRGLKQQEYPLDALRVIVVDDQSTDETLEVARETIDGDPRFTLMRAGPLPPGWAGKPHACWEGVRQAPQSEWLCFLDADTVPGPHLLASAVRFATEHRVDLLSLEPFQELGSLWERTIVPAAMFLLAFTHHLREVNDPSSPLAEANGQFLLCRRGVYEAIGGHAAVAEEICEDSALAQLVKRAGFRFMLAGGESLIRVRMYSNFNSLREGTAKNAVEMSGGRVRAAGGALLALALAWSPILLPYWNRRAPPAGNARQGAWGAAVSGVGSLMLSAAHCAAARRLRIPIWYGLLFPLGYTGAAVIAIESLVRHVVGQVSWKGRQYRPSPQPVPADRPALRHGARS